MSQETPPPAEPRESLWSVPAGFWVLYFTLFALLDAIGVGYAVWHEIRYGPGENIHAHIRAVIPDTSAIGIRAAITAFTFTEGLRITMIISNYLKIRLLKPAEERIMARGRAEERAQSEKQIAEERARSEKRIAETHAEANRKVAEWNRRRLEAQERGEPFDEPPPDLTQP